MKILNGTILAASPAQDAIGLECLTNQSWLYSWKLMNLDIEHFARDGLHFDGSVFEGECHAVTCADNGRNGMTFRNNGPVGDSASSRPSPSSAARCARTAMPASRRRATPLPGAARPQHLADLLRREQGAGPARHQRLLHGHGLRLREQRRLRHQARQRRPPVRLPGQHLQDRSPIWSTPSSTAAACCSMAAASRVMAASRAR